MQKFLNVYKFAIVILAVVIIAFCVSYRYGISPVSKTDKPVTITIEENSTYLSISTLLKENNLIRSQTFYKMYIKIFKPSNLQVGTYTLNENMGVKQIISVLEENKITTGPTFVIPEGKHITDVAEAISKVSNLKANDLLSYWQGKEVIANVISKYWFIDESIQNSKLKYALEGYFFPATYELKSKDASMEEITYMMLDKMNEVLSKYKSDIEKSKYSVHEILTLASIVETEAILDEDRPIISRVFINRLNKSMPLQSCATIGYAIGEWKLTYNTQDLAIDSPYNTYKYYGLPVGPGDMPGEESIKAVLYPDDNDYLYFLANVYNSNDNKTYFSKTYSEHQQKCLQYLGKSC